MAIRGSSAPQVLIGPTGSDPTFDELVEGLAGYGCEVTTFDRLPIDTPMPKRAKALIVVTQRDTVDSPEGQRVQGLIREAGYVEGTLGRSQVVLLVDESAPRLSDTGLDQIRYPSGNLAQVLPEVVARFGFAITARSDEVDAGVPRESRDLHRQEPLIEQFRSEDLKVPWVLVTLVVLVALLVAVIFVRNNRGVETETAGESATATEVSPAGDESLSSPSTAEVEVEVEETIVVAESATGENGDSSLSGAKVSVGPDGQDSAQALASTVPSPDNDDSTLSSATAVVDPGQPTTAIDPTRPTTSATAAIDPTRPTAAIDPTRPTTSGTAAIDPTGPTVSTTVDPGQPSTSNLGGGSTTVISPPNMIVPSTTPNPAGGHGQYGTGLTNDRPGPEPLPGSGIYVCYLNVVKGTILPERTLCEGGGTLIVTGWAGPWHNELWALAVVDGVSGAIYAERRPNGATVGPPVVPITPGVIYTNPADYRYGSQTLRVEFTADLQHFHMYQHPDRGGRESVLVFDLH